MRFHPSLLLLPFLAVLAWLAWPASDPAPAQTPTAKADDVKSIIVPFVTKHCIDCHGPKKKKADLALHVFTDSASILKARKTWTAVLTQLHAGEMPPSGRPKPAHEDVEKFVKAVTGIFDRHDASAPRDPGRVTMRRLNRTEYENTIRDLVGVEFSGDELPSDDVGFGFDNIGDVLTISPLHMERYLAAAENITTRAIVVGPLPKLQHRSQSAQFLEPGGTFPAGKSRILTSPKESLHTPFEVSLPGQCEIAVKLTPDQLGDEPVKFALQVDGKDAKTFETKLTDTKQATYKASVTLPKGEHRVAVVFLNPFKEPKEEKKDEKKEEKKGEKKEEKKQRGIRVSSLALDGPGDTRPESMRMLLADTEKLEGPAKTKFVLKRFLDRAYRRPATKEELDRVLVVAEKGDGSIEAKVQLAMQAILVSPKFLFRVELDDRPKEKVSHPLDDYALASRLSYFVWNSMPDQELFDLAAKKTLHNALDAQVKRMLHDPKSSALVDNFAVQWLQLRPLASFAPDGKTFPRFNDSLRRDMLKETKLFIQAIVDEDRSVLDLIDGKFTFLNERLAVLYGIADTNGNPRYQKAVTKPGRPIQGDEKFVRVSLEPTVRGGILTQASILAVTSNPTRTSPVKRGRWVLEQILGTPPPPPPPDVPALDTGKQTTGTLRQRMEQHRENVACAGCHARMDPIGFAFENFNAIGEFRKTDGTAPIDASGTLPGGQTFNGPADLQKILRGKTELFGRCLTEKMLTYALGRGLESYDKPAIDGIVAALQKNDFKFSILVASIAQSDPFRLRRGKDQE